MKRYFLLFILLFSLFSCEEDVKFNNPTFQATKDNVFWRAVQAIATVNSGGSLVIEAYTATEVVVLKTNSAAVGTYSLGTSPTRSVSYVYTDPETKETINFSTGSPSPGSNAGNGEIVITDYDAVAKTISGTFKFNLVNTFDDPLVAPTMNFQHGVFYKLPVTIK
ncbi:MAG TPA: DUF6252 family protein [Flavobacterium sp.]|nr:DUF6252 family protein [Flavobacterium sp.]